MNSSLTACFLKKRTFDLANPRHIIHSLNNLFLSDNAFYLRSLSWPPRYKSPSSAVKILFNHPMTVAICYKCGEFKFDAFTPCGQCETRPSAEDGLASSLDLTDHYVDHPTPEVMSADIKRGKPLRLNPEDRDNLLRVIRQFPLHHGNSPNRKPRWKFRSIVEIKSYAENIKQF